jgi:hypothetical protein
MNRKPKKRERNTQVLQVWTLAQARKSLPLITSIMTSVREHHLEALAQQRRARLLADRPGRPGREALIAQTEAVREGQGARERFETALEELLALNIYCLDPIRGLGFIPTVHRDQLAWLVFDVFEPQALSTWRYNEDALATRRPITELEAKSGTDSMVV